MHHVQKHDIGEKTRPYKLWGGRGRFEMAILCHATKRKWANLFQIVIDQLLSMLFKSAEQGWASQGSISSSS